MNAAGIFLPVPCSPAPEIMPRLPSAPRHLAAMPFPGHETSCGAGEEGEERLSLPCGLFWVFFFRLYNPTPALPAPAEPPSQTSGSLFCAV